MQKFNPEIPYNELPFLPPSSDLEIPSVLKACIKANKELAKLKIAVRLIPNQTVLINSIPLLESQASSAIENIVTTTDVRVHRGWEGVGQKSHQNSNMPQQRGSKRPVWVEGAHSSAR